MSGKQFATLFAATIVIVTVEGLTGNRPLGFHNYIGLLFVWLVLAFINTWSPELAKAFAWLFLVVLLLAKGPTILSKYSGGQRRTLTVVPNPLGGNGRPIV